MAFVLHHGGVEESIKGELQTLNCNACLEINSIGEKGEGRQFFLLALKTCSVEKSEKLLRAGSLNLQS